MNNVTPCLDNVKTVFKVVHFGKLFCYRIFKCPFKAQSLTVRCPWIGTMKNAYVTKHVPET